MVELLATGERFVQRSLVSQIPLNPLDGQILDILKVRTGAGYDADVNAAVDHCAHHCAADESGCTSDESFHRSFAGERLVARGKG
jgi:hypothetical protein